MTIEQENLILRKINELLVEENRMLRNSLTDSYRFCAKALAILKTDAEDVQKANRLLSDKDQRE